MITLIVKKTFLELTDSFVVQDKSGKQLYNAKSEGNILNKGFFLYDEGNHLHAHIFKELDKKHLFYHIDVDGDRIATITTNKGFKTKGFTVEPQGMVTQYNRSKLVVTLMKNDEPVGVIKAKLFRFKKTYVIQFEERSEELTFILIALTLFIDERDPAFFGSIFKKMEWG